MMIGKISASVVVAAAMMMGSLAVSHALKPTERIANIKPKMVLKELFPEKFGEWQELTSVQPVIPDPVSEAALAALYSQTVARTYVNAKGELIMLTVAYGDDQNSESSAAHRPEFCYSAAGFVISNLGVSDVDLGGHTVQTRHLKGVMDRRQEFITYWVTLDEKATLPGVGRKLAQLSYGLRGQIADGMLVRVSSLSDDPETAYELQRRFLKQLYDQVSPTFRARVFGA